MGWPWELNGSVSTQPPEQCWARRVGDDGCDYSWFGSAPEQAPFKSSSRGIHPHPHIQGPVQAEACRPGEGRKTPKEATLLRKRERSSQRLHMQLREI